MAAYAVKQKIDNCGFKYIAKGNPIQESQKSLQSSFDKGYFLSFLENLRTEFEDLREFAAHLVF